MAPLACFSVTAHQWRLCIITSSFSILKLVFSVRDLKSFLCCASWQLLWSADEINACFPSLRSVAVLFRAHTTTLTWSRPRRSFWCGLGAAVRSAAEFQGQFSFQLKWTKWVMCERNRSWKMLISVWVLGSVASLLPKQARMIFPWKSQHWGWVPPLWCSSETSLSVSLFSVTWHISAWVGDLQFIHICFCIALEY